MNIGAFVAADHVDDLAQLHAENFHGFVSGLSNRNDLVVRFEVTAQIGGPTGNNFFYDADVVFHSKQRTDAKKAKPHVDSKILIGIGGVISRMRIVESRDGAEEKFSDLHRFEFRGGLAPALVAFAHDLLGVVHALLVQHFREQFELE